jgi:hypothetical protein
MEKKLKPKQKTTHLRLQTETLHRLEASQLREVAGGGRMWRPGLDDTLPIDDTTTG